MDALHIQGVAFIQWIQQFKILENLLLNVSHIGSPLMAYSLVFPLAYYVNPQLGLLTMLCATFSEWLSGILKWVLHGHRPYWWVRLYAQKTGTAVIPIRQFTITCETGPGSPSGHCMITLAALVPVVIYLHRSLPRFYQYNRSRLHGQIVLLVFTTFVVLIGLSRCYMAAHFPHQVVSGIISGLTLGYLFTHFSDVLRLIGSPSKASLARTALERIIYLFHHPEFLVLLGVSSLLIAWLFSLSLQNFFGVDVNWSIALAQSACHRSEWVHLSSSLMVGFARIAGYLCGLSVAIRFNLPSDRLLLSSNIKFSVIPMACLALLSTKIFESVVRQLVHSIFTHLLPTAHGTGPSYVLLFSSILEGSLNPLVSVWLLPIAFSYM